jgi:citrate lyase subunit beta / citryl-CoA lyase
VIDLEDAVEASQKINARRIVGEWLATAPASSTATFLRVNAPGTHWLDDDLAWLKGLGVAATHVHAVVVPKTENAEALVRICDAAASPVLPLLETARGIVNAVDILGAKADIAAVLFGAEDLTAELGIPRTLQGEELLLARSRVVLAAAVAGVDPVDAVWTDLSAPDGLRQDGTRAKALGFRGKMAIHPDQIAIINEVFSPTVEEIAAARRIVAADDHARARGEGVLRLDDRMVDAPVIKRARRVLALAERLR